MSLIWRWDIIDLYKYYNQIKVAIKTVNCTLWASHRVIFLSHRYLSLECSQPDEAVAAAIEEFTVQGVDLSNIITTANGGQIDDHPFVTRVSAIRVALVEKTLLDDPLRDLVAFVIDDEAQSTSKQVQNLAAIAHASNVTSILVQCLAMYTSNESESQQQGPSSFGALTALQLLCSLIPLSRDIAAQFRAASGPETATSLLDALLRIPPADPHLVSMTLKLATVSAIKDEEGKSSLMTVGIGTQTITILDEACNRDDHCYDVSASFIANGCALIIALTSADDLSVPGSSAFANARALGKSGAVTVLTRTLKLAKNRDLPLSVVAASCDALRQVVANEELCLEAEEKGIVPLALGMLDAVLHDLQQQQQQGVAVALGVSPHKSEPLSVSDHHSQATCLLVHLKSIVALLRQLASSDAVKGAIANADGLEYVQRCLETVATAATAATAGPQVQQFAVQHQCFGLLSNLTLRAPETASRAIDLGVVDTVVMAMKLLCQKQNDAFNDKKKTHNSVVSALRQGCMAIRNIASRCPERRGEMRASGVEEVIRQAVGLSPTMTAQLKDVASAALRDLGLTNYQL